MDAVHEEKAVFTKFHLEEFLRTATKGEVFRAVYLVKNGEEFVELVFRNGYSKRVCVSADSLLAMSRDVLAAL